MTYNAISMVCLPCSFGSEIVIGEKLELASLIKAYLPKTCHRLAIITDANVAKLHGSAFSEALDQAGIPHVLIPFPAGEESKTRKTKDRLEDLLLSNNFGRDCCIVALGGGVVIDLAGFVAATYARGVPFIAVPTTLMGMVDAAIGGKVAVNTPLAKNAIGAFYPAKAVLIDTSFLNTLSTADVQSGMAEVYKHAFIASEPLLHLLRANAPILEIIQQSNMIKKEIVENDFLEEGRRRILNFGHTIGHALENASGYQLHHGHAVAIGMRAESWISHALGYLSQSDLDLIEKSLEHFPPSPPLPHKKIYQALSLDKKNQKSKVRFVLLEKIGSPLAFDGNFCSHVEEELIEEAISRICPA